MMIELMEPVEANKFVMLIYWWRIEAYTGRMVKNIPDNFSSTGFGVDIGKLHIWSCVHHIYISNTNIIDSGDEDV